MRFAGGLSARLYEAHLISTIVDMNNATWINDLYEAHLISTIVDKCPPLRPSIHSMRLI